MAPKSLTIDPGVLSYETGDGDFAQALSFLDFEISACDIWSTRASRLIWLRNFVADRVEVQRKHSNSYPYLALSRRLGMPYGEVLAVVDQIEQERSRAYMMPAVKPRNYDHILCEVRNEYMRRQAVQEDKLGYFVDPPIVWTGPNG